MPMPMLMPMPMPMLTFGAEIELADVDRRTVLPSGCSWNKLERDIINSDGTAIDPTGKLHTIGGEINTLPTNSVSEQVQVIGECLERLPTAKVNFRTWLHIHIGLGKTMQLETIQHLQRYAWINEPLAMRATGLNRRPAGMPPNTWAWYQETQLPSYKFGWAQNSQTIEDFRQSFFKNKAGKVAPITFKRSGINIYSLFKHGTVEFRIFFGSTYLPAIEGALLFCQDFMTAGLAEEHPSFSSWYKVGKYTIPRELPYDATLDAQWYKNKAAKTGGIVAQSRGLH